MLSTVTSNRTVSNNVQIGARAKAEAAETGTSGSQDAVQIGLQAGDIPGDIPLSICWGLGSQSAPVVESKPSIAVQVPHQAPVCETSSAPTSSFDIPGDMPFLVAWGLNKPQPPSFASSPASSAPAVVAQPKIETPATSIPTDLNSLDVPGDIPSHILWNLR